MWRLVPVWFGVSVVLVLASVSPAWAMTNINTATVEELDRDLKQIGLQKAQAIVTYRQEHGPFQTIDELAQVKGIGLKLIELNRNHLIVQRAEATTTGREQEPRASQSAVEKQSPPQAINRPETLGRSR